VQNGGADVLNSVFTILQLKRVGVFGERIMVAGKINVRKPCKNIF
jgi:hypothetical protein